LQLALLAGDTVEVVFECHAVLVLWMRMISLATV
jgi:hypothetical protein